MKMHVFIQFLCVKLFCHTAQITFFDSQATSNHTFKNLVCSVIHLKYNVHASMYIYRKLCIKSPAYIQVLERISIEAVIKSPFKT